VKIIKETVGTEHCSVLDHSIKNHSTQKCKIYTRPFDNYKNQKNFGLKYCTKEWILAIDADERILPELKEEIQAELENPKYDFFAFPFLTYFLKKPLKYGLIYPAYHTRLFKKADCRWVRTVHEQLKCNKQEIGADSGKVKKMKNNVLHYSFDSVEHYFKKFNYYTSLDAVEMLKNKKDRFNRHVKFQPNNLWSCVWFFLYQPFRFFVRRFFRYKGYKDGVYGFIYAVFSACYEAVVRVKYWSKI